MAKLLPRDDVENAIASLTHLVFTRLGGLTDSIPYV